MVIENRPGSAGVVAGETIAKGAPDGYTLVVATSAVMAIRPTLFKQRPYDPQKDFVPIALYVKSPFILVVNPSLPIHSVPELINYVKERPGKLSYSSSGVGGAPHLSLELLNQRFGFDIDARALSQQPAVDRTTSPPAMSPHRPSPRPARRCR